MTYASERDKLSRQPLYIVELDLDTKISSTGKEYLSQGEQPFGQEFWPCVQSVDWIPTRADETGGLGRFGNVVIKCKDFNFGSKGTYFAKLIDANAYYLNRLIKIHVGFYKLGETFSFSNFQERRYFLKKITGPDEKGNVTIEGVDILSRLSESEVPTATEGELNASITDSTTGTVNIVDNTGFNSGGGYAIIDDEIISYTGVSGADSITGVARAQGGTIAESHDAASPVRNIYQASGNVVDEIRTLIEDFTDIDHATYLPDADWNTERDGVLSGFTVDLWIIEPTEVSKIIDEMCSQTYVNVWWDDAAQEIKLKGLGPTLSAIQVWNDDEHILDARVTIKRDHKKILSSVWAYFDKRDKTKGNDAKEFDKIYINLNTDIETGLGEPRVKKIYANHLGSGGASILATVTGRLIGQFQTPIEFSCYVDAKDSDIEVGDAIQIETDLIQNASDGERKPVIMRVIEKAQQDNNRYFYKMVRSGQEIGDQYFYWGPDTLTSYTTESAANKLKYGWYANNTPQMSNGDDPYLWL